MQPAFEHNLHTIVYLAYKLDSSKYQAILSIYTLYHQLAEDNANFQFIIYSDADTSLFTKYLGALPVKCEVLSKENIKRFRGPHDFVFRIKPHVIQACFAKYKSNLLYLDTDTFFLRNPRKLLESIKPGRTIMNVEEYDFVDGGVEHLHWFYQRQALKHHTYTVQGLPTTIPLSTKMWNAGVIGISYADTGLIDEIISLNDKIYENTQIFIVEQFATSYVLQTYSELHSSEDYIEHYWSKETKNSFDLRIPLFLKENADIKGAALYRAAFDFALATCPIRTPNNETLLSRVIGRLKVITKVARRGHL